jgi:hypothetical protein
MTQHLRQLISRLTATALVGLLLLGIGFQTPPALAAIRPLEEGPGQVVYQARQTLTDQHGHRWQAIAFKRIRSDQSEILYLRLAGFPGSAAIDRAQPLTFTSSLGQTLTAADVSSQMFTDAERPEPHIGQYNLQPIATQLRPELPWQLTLATTTQPLILALPAAAIQDWQTLAQVQLDSPAIP